MTVLDFLRRLHWLDGSPLVAHLEAYRQRIFAAFFDEHDEAERPRYNLGLFGRAKKNWKSADLVLACLYALLTDSPGGNQAYLVANDQGQAADDLVIAKRLLKANPTVNTLVRVKTNVIERKDGAGFIEVLPAQDVAGSHGKTYRLLGVDEIHEYRNWNLLEALAPDPTRPDCQQWITSYASLFHRPGAPLFDLLQQARLGVDPRLLLSWYAADFCTDPDFADKTPEARANPSMDSWQNPEYLVQQQRRLPAHKYRRLHLNLPGLPEGSAFQPDPVMNAITRGVPVRLPEPGVSYRAFVDMSGGSSDDAALAVGHEDADGRTVVDRVLNQGPPPPFDPRKAVERFAGVLAEYRVAHVVGDRYAGRTFIEDFARFGISYTPSERSASEAYEALEPRLNSQRVICPDVPVLEQQLLGLMWRGGKIDHVAGEHDDYAAALAGLVALGEHGSADGWIQYYRQRLEQVTGADGAPTGASGATALSDDEENALVLRHQTCRTQPPRLRVVDGVQYCGRCDLRIGVVGEPVQIVRERSLTP